MNKFTFFANAALYLLGLSECPIKPVDTSQNGIEKDWQNIGMDIQNVMNSYGQTK